MSLDALHTTVIILNCSYVFIALALLLRDILWLRAAWTAGQVCMILYGLLSLEPVIMAWNSLFFSLNMLQVMRIIRERQDVHVPEELEDLREKVFPLMSKREFLKFWNMGQVRSVTDERIVSQGDQQKLLFLIMDGKVNVDKSGLKVVRLGRNSFFAEMSFLTDMPAAADVTAVDTVKFNSWEQEQVHGFRETDPELYIKIQSAVSRDLVRKIQHEIVAETLY